MSARALVPPSRDLSASRRLVEAIVGRTLRKAEQAIDVLRLDQALSHAKEDLEAAIRAEMLRASAAWAAGQTPSPYLAVDEAMLAILDSLAQLGAAEGLLELERLGYVGLRVPPARAFVAGPGPRHHRDVRGYLGRELNGIGVRIEDDLLLADLSGASEVAIANALMGIPGARDLASRVISSALMDGFGATFEANQDLVGSWEYTAVMDGATCDPCGQWDGAVFQSLGELFQVLPDFGPNPECSGGGRCRCRAVPAAP